MQYSYLISNFMIIEFRKIYIAIYWNVFNSTVVMTMLKYTLTRTTAIS